MPIHARRPTGVPRIPASSAVHTGWVQTSATEDATVVRLMLGTHVAK